MTRMSTCIGRSADWYRNKRLLITYDTQTVALQKTAYINQLGLGGAMWWELSGDAPENTGRNLVRTVKEALGALEYRENELRYPGSSEFSPRTETAAALTDHPCEGSGPLDLVLERPQSVCASLTLSRRSDAVPFRSGLLRSSADARRIRQSPQRHALLICMHERRPSSSCPSSYASESSVNTLWLGQPERRFENAPKCLIPQASAVIRTFQGESLLLRFVSPCGQAPDLG